MESVAARLGIGSAQIIHSWVRKAQLHTGLELMLDDAATPAEAQARPVLSTLGDAQSGCPS